MIHVAIDVEEAGGKRWVWRSSFSSELIEVIRASKNPAILKDFFDLMSASAIVSVINPAVIPPGVQKELSIT